MKADPDAQRRLLDLQAIDTALAQLAHRRRNLPEIAELDRLARELSALEDERIRAQVGRRRPGPRHRPAGQGRRAGTDRGRTGTGPGSTPAPARPGNSRRCSTNWPPWPGARASWRTPSWS